MAKLIVNGITHDVNVEPDMPLLWVLRDILGLTGTKFGCGVALCGACTVHVDGEPVRACVTPMSGLDKKQITTIEGLPSDATHPVQQAWVDEQVTQCGFCQSGQIMSAVALLQRISNPTDTDINTAMSGNICRCGSYQRIRSAIKKAAALAIKLPSSKHVPSS